MPPTNGELARMFRELADLLEIQEANPFRVRAYRRAADTLQALGRRVSDMVAAGDDLTTLDGVGADLAAKLEEAVDTGSFALLDKERRNIPRGVLALLDVPGLGPKRARSLYEELGVDSIAALRKAIEAKRVRTVKRFGPRAEEKLAAALETMRERQGRHFLNAVTPLAESLVDHLKHVRGTGDVVVAGSYRRRRETVGDLDIVAVARSSEALMDAFTGHPMVAEVMSRGKTRATVVLGNDIQVDLRVVPRRSFGAALYYFTGSKPHNIALRRLAIKQGIKINEYGVFRGDEQIGGRHERDVPAAVGLPLVPPELREDRGELEAARKDALPQLVTLQDIRGDLHSHTTASDGRNELDQMVQEADGLHYDYLAVTDHSPRTAIANGLDEERLRAQCRRIDDLNDEREGLRVLKSAEVDILKDGSLDYSKDTLDMLDIAVCSVHFREALEPKEQTERVLRAMSDEHASILGHPTGRLIGKRDPMPLDMDRLMQNAADEGWCVELNAQPDRMDLSDRYLRTAKEYGVKVAVSTDAHSTEGLHRMRFGVDQARRGWLEPDDVLNTRSTDEMLALVR